MKYKIVKETKPTLKTFGKYKAPTLAEALCQVHADNHYPIMDSKANAPRGQSSVLPRYR